MENINSVVELMRQHGMRLPEEKLRIQIPNAKHLMELTLNRFINQNGEKAKWLPEYNDIVDWLEDNNGLGLLLHGKCGLGKTIMGRYVIPGIILYKLNKIVTCYDTNVLNAKLDEALGKKLISIDDVGTEEVSVKFGEKRLAFAELMDMVEKQSKLIIITTNLSAEQLIAKYGDRTMDRIIATTKRIAFNGDSFRK